MTIRRENVRVRVSNRKAKWKVAYDSAPSVLRSEESVHIFARFISAVCDVLKAFSVQKEDKQKIGVARDTQASMLPVFHFAVHSWRVS